MGIASLQMYDLPEFRAATDAWWQGLARAFRRAAIAEVPDRLARETNYREAWLRPDLLFSQTCGYPLTHALAGRVRLVATPVYAAEGCEAANYCSFVVVQAGNAAADIADLRGAVCAFNGPDSQSGYNTLRALVAPYAQDGRFFSRVVHSGGHAVSLELVASGAADVAAIDCVTYALLQRYRPAALAGTRVLCRTDWAPNLPYITCGTADDDRVERLRHGLEIAFADPSLTEARDAMMLEGAVPGSAAAYDRIVEQERAAFRAGYRELA